MIYELTTMHLHLWGTKKAYEFREYQLAVGGIKKSIDAWEKALPARQKISPVIIFPISVILKTSLNS